MKKIAGALSIVLLGALVAPAPALAATVEVLRAYDAGANELPEGLAVDKRGRIYLTMPFIGELRRVARDGSEHVVTELPTGNGFGALGLAVDAPGNVYAGVVTFIAETHGVWRVTPSGEKSRLAGSEAIGFPNGVAFDDRGNLYVTDSIGGAVWRIPRGGSASMWADSPLLDGDDSAPLPFPIGANGITYYKGAIYATNTELGSVVRIPILPDGSAGVPVLLARSGALGGADGIAPDINGDLYVAVIAQSTIVRVDGTDGTITTLADGGDGLDFPSSLAFGTGRGERKTMYAVNFSTGPFFGQERTHGPALLRMPVGVAGLPQP